MSAMPSRFADPPFTLPPSPCMTCRWRDYGRPTCAAFPNGIPRAIFDGGNPHTTPFPGDQGIRYQPTPYRYTDGPVTATFLWSRAGYIGALWVGDDGTIGGLETGPGNDTWAKNIANGLAFGYEPADILAYWLDNAFSASQPRRFDSSADVEREHTRLRGGTKVG